MPSSFVHADRLKFWEITMHGDYRNGILEVCYHIWAYRILSMTHINKAQMTPTILIRS